MGAGTSGLQRDLDDLDGVINDLGWKLNVHQTEYNLFPSSDGVALRDQVNAHLLGYNALGELQASYNGFPSSEGEALSKRVADLQNKGLQAGGPLALDVDAIHTKGLALKDTYGSLISELAIQQEQFKSTATQGCQVSPECPHESNYATSSALGTLGELVGTLTTTSTLSGLMQQVSVLDRAPSNEVDMAAVDLKADQTDLTQLYERVGAAAGSSPATGLFQLLADTATRAQVDKLADVIGTASTPNKVATGLFLRVDNANASVDGLATVGLGATGADAATGLFLKADTTSAPLATLATSVGSVATGSIAATGLVQTVNSKVDQVEFATLLATVGNANSGLVQRVDGLEAAPRGNPVDRMPVDITSIQSGKKEATMAWSACYPDYEGRLREHIEKDCKCRGDGWSHGEGGLMDCWRLDQYDDWDDVNFKMGVCHKDP